MASSVLDRYPLPNPNAVRRSTASDEVVPSGQVSQQVDRIERRLSSKESSNTHSWASSGSQSLRQSSEPLTPPDPTESTPLANGDNANASSDETATPLIQRSPPTPDHTPPKRRKHTHERLHAPPRAPPSIASHQASSITGSFMTAQEEFSTDSLLVDESPASMPANQAAIGLGLGLETPDGQSTPTMHAPRIAGESPFLVETWNHTDVASDPFLAPESMAVQDLDDFKHPLRRPRRYPGDDFQASLERARGGLEDASISSMERGGSRGRPDSQDSDLLFVDKKRLSDISASSQVVQALVISTPRRKRQRLRHASKNESLRTVSSPLENSNRSSIASSIERPRLHRVPRIDWKRVSQNSDSGISMGSDQKQLPPPDLLGRMSSVKRSSAKERTLARRLSDLAKETEEARPVTAPERVGPPESSYRSQSLQTRERVSNRGRRTIDYPPIIPPRGSSLSAPTSQTNSRTTSLTTGTVRRHPPANLHVPAPTIAGAQRSPKQAVQFSPRLPKPSRTNPEIIIDDQRDDRGHDEHRSAYRRSALTTPFSGASAFSSSTPGPFEVDEATMVDIYPHNNTSVLMVEQNPAPGTEAAHLSQMSRNVRAQLDELEGHRGLGTKPFSPLQNPRPAPAPIPIEPAPAPTISVDPPESRLERTPSGRMLSMRRALSARRRSDPQIGPASRPLVDRRFEPGTRPMPKASPLWRPWAFWNDVETGSDPEDGDAYVRNTLGLPQRKFIPGPGSLTRRIGSLRRRKEQQAAQAQAAEANQQIADVENRVGVLSRRRGPGAPRVTPFATMAEAIEKLRHRRAEARSERNREQIRRRIGPVVMPGDARHF